MDDVHERVRMESEKSSCCHHRVCVCVYVFYFHGSQETSLMDPIESKSICSFSFFLLLCVLEMWTSLLNVSRQTTSGELIGHLRVELLDIPKKKSNLQF
jgi:hypothetical protein